MTTHGINNSFISLCKEEESEMRYTMNEKKVLKKLNIPDFKHMTKDKVVEFATMLPHMDPEVAKACLEQFPEFTNFAGEIVGHYKEVVTKALNSNDNSQAAYYSACNNIIDALKEELKNPNIDSDERSRIEDKMIVVAGMIGEKDTENKKFLIAVLSVFGATAVGALAAAAAVIGANSNLSIDKDTDLDDDDYDDIIDMVDDIE